MQDDNREMGEEEFPFTSADTGPTPGPEPSSDAPVQPTESQPGTSDGVESSVEFEPLPEMDPRIREDFEGLLYLGKLTDSFVWAGHRFVIRTMTAGETLEVGLMHREYVGTLGDVKAYQMLANAACLVSVDGKPLPQPLGPEESGLLTRFEYVKKWFPWTHDAIYEHYMLLELRVTEVINAMGKEWGSMTEAA